MDRLLEIFSFIVLLLLMFGVLMCTSEYQILNIRLVDGTSPNEGRAEFQVRLEDDSPAKWGAVCGEHWELDEADWVCRQLGYLGADFAIQGASNHFGNGTLPLVFKLSSGCNTGDDLLACDLDDKPSDCPQPSGTAGVICQKPDYVGCYRSGGRGFNEARIGAALTASINDACIALCRNMSAIYVYQTNNDQRNCHCLNTTEGNLQNNGECSDICRGNTKQRCGRGRDRFSVFNVTTGFCKLPQDPNLTVQSHIFSSEYMPTDASRYGDIINAQCTDGFDLIGDPILQCNCSLHLGQPIACDWNGTLPRCEFIEPTISGLFTDVTMVTMDAGDDAGAGSTSPTPRTPGKPTAGAGSNGRITVTVALITIGVFAFLCIILAFILIFMRRRQKQRSKSGSPDGPLKDRDRFNNQSYGMFNIPDNQAPGYYEVGPKSSEDAPNVDRNYDGDNSILHRPSINAQVNKHMYEEQITRKEQGEAELIDNILYKPSTGVESLPNEYELEPNLADNRKNDQSAAEEGVLIENVLYRPSTTVLPTGNVLYRPNNTVSTGGESELIDNVLYKSSDGIQQDSMQGPKYYELGPSIANDPNYYELDPNISDAPKYYELEPSGDARVDHTATNGPNYYEMRPNTTSSE